MGIIELLLIAVGLSMDAFAVAVTNGLCNKNIKIQNSISVALTFGLFQGLMPVIGFALAQLFKNYVTAFDHYIALILLLFIGGKMLIEAIKSNGDEESACATKRLSFGSLMLQGVATSIDALAVGVTFSTLDVNIVSSASIIALTTFCFSFAGVYIGKAFGSLLNKKAEIAGGIILIAIGVKIFIEHMFF